MNDPLPRSLPFTKMQSLGNDFVVVDATTDAFALSKTDIAAIADRHTGVGFDQMLVAERSKRGGVDFKFRIFNADGGEVDQCGNGARCFARFLRDKGLTESDRIVVDTRSGQLMTLSITDADSVTVELETPKFKPADIPLTFGANAGAARTTDLEPEIPIDIDGVQYPVSALSVGNPHAVMRVDNVDNTPVETLGPKIEHHLMFPERANAGFMQIVSPSQIRLRVFERGVGETRACGSGACAAVVAGVRLGLLSDHVAVDLPGGRLHIEWQGQLHSIFMTGPAVTVFEGRYNLRPL